MTKEKIFYGWWIALACFLIMALGFAMVYSCNSIYITYITTELGVSRSAYSVCSLISALSGMLIAPFAGKLMAKKDMRLIMAGALTGLCICYGSFSFAVNIYYLYFVNIFLGVFFLCSMTLPISILLTRWFVKYRGTVQSMVFAGSSLGGMILVPVVTRFITALGWRTTYRIMAVFMFVTLVPLVLLVIRNAPSDKNTVPLGSEDVSRKTENTAQEGIPLKTLKKTSFFILFVTCIIALNICSSSLQHVPSHLIDSGLSSSSSATIVSLYLGLGILGKILLGAVFDKLGVKGGLIFGLGTFIAGFMLMIVSKNTTAFTIMALFYGIGLSSGTVFPPILTANLFGTKYYGEVYGFVTSFTQLGGAIGPLSIAALYDLSGNYKLSWSICIFLCVYIMASIIFIGTKIKKLNYE